METGTNKKTVSIYEQLHNIQQELKAPKSETGRFGKHRNVEGILEGLKPVLKKHGCAIILDSSIVQVGERIYVKATAKLVNKETNSVEASAYAWEGELSRGLDAPQVTGSASSYARKYALGGLFAVDDTKDPDGHTDPAPTPAKPAAAPPAQPSTPASAPQASKDVPASAKQVDMIAKMAKERFATKEEFKEFAESTVGADENLSLKQASNLITALYSVEKLPADEKGTEGEG